MYKITIKGEAKTDYQHLDRLDGIDCQDEFSEYFNKEEQVLKDKNVCNGYLRFEYSDGKLWSLTTYESPVLLTEEELDILANYTKGQWSDGIGEGFEQEDCYYDRDTDEGVCISPWFSGQVLIKEQIEVAQPFDWDRINKKAAAKKAREERLNELFEKSSETMKKADDLLKSLGINPNKL